MLVFSGLVAELLIFSGRFLVDVFALLTGLLAFCGPCHFDVVALALGLAG